MLSSYSGHRLATVGTALLESCAICYPVVLWRLSRCDEIIVIQIAKFCRYLNKKKRAENSYILETRIDPHMTVCGQVSIFVFFEKSYNVTFRQNTTANFFLALKLISMLRDRKKFINDFTLKKIDWDFPIN